MKIIFSLLSLFFHQGLFASGQELTISTAISLKEAVSEVASEFQKQWPGVKIHLNFGSSGQLKQQVEWGAPIDIFISASQLEMNDLQQKNLIQRLGITPIAGNSIALVSHRANKFGPLTFSQFGALKFNRLAIGLPSLVPLGHYAQEALKHIGQWENNKDKLVFTQNARQSLSYILTREVDLGFVYHTDYLKHRENLDLICEIPSQLHALITYPMAKISSSLVDESYLKWKDFITSEKGQKIFLHYGFKPVQKP